MLLSLYLTSGPSSTSQLIPIGSPQLPPPHSSIKGYPPLVPHIISTLDATNTPFVLAETSV